MCSPCSVCYKTGRGKLDQSEVKYHPNLCVIHQKKLTLQKLTRDQLNISTI